MDAAHLTPHPSTLNAKGILSLRAVPISLRDAREFVAQLHRHHSPPQGGKFAIGAQKDGKLVGVVIAGRPTARKLDDGRTGEVTRLCTDGTPNACSFLYSRARRAMQQMGYERFVTFILEDEHGGSVKADGWELFGVTDGGSWNRESRPREDKAPTCKKKRYMRT